MIYSVKILKDSVGPGPFAKRITTWELAYPRFVHAELMTHRLFSRNSASSRAIPNERLRQRIADDPAMPVFWGANQKGMQAVEELSKVDRARAKEAWLLAGKSALEWSEVLAKIGVHKQLANRLLEPWMFITVILTATEFDNWFHLRDHAAAQPEIAWVAREMHRQYLASKPQELPEGEWHLPMIDEEDWVWARGARDAATSEITLLKRVATGRIARVSYLTHDGRRDPREDIALHDKLCAGPNQNPPQPGHWSPFEHVAQAMSAKQWNDWVYKQAADDDHFFDQTTFGNFIGWKQYRKEFEAEHYRGAR